MNATRPTLARPLHCLSHRPSLQRRPSLPRRPSLSRRSGLWIALGLAAVSAGCTTERGAIAGPWPAAVASTPVDTTGDGLSVDIFRNVVRGKVIAAFEALNRRDAKPVLALMADDVRYSFEGDHALGGTRVTKAGVEQWFERLFRLLPSQFTLRSVEVAGWPWRATAYIVFEDRVSPRVGDAYVNRGVQIVEMEWGKAVAIRTFVDTDKVVRALRVLADNGVAEALAAPITD